MRWPVVLIAIAGCYLDSELPESPHGGALTGTVSDYEGNPLPGIEVTAKGHEVRSARTGEDGTFVIDDLSPDDYLVSMNHTREDGHTTSYVVIHVDDEPIDYSRSYDPRTGTTSFFHCACLRDMTPYLEQIDLAEQRYGK